MNGERTARKGRLRMVKLLKHLVLSGTTCHHMPDEAVSERGPARAALKELQDARSEPADERNGGVVMSVKIVVKEIPAIFGTNTRSSTELPTWKGLRKVKNNKSEFRKNEIRFGKLRPYFHKVGLAPVDGVWATDIDVVNPKLTVWLSYVLSADSPNESVGYTDQTSSDTKMSRTSSRIIKSYTIHPPMPIAQALQDLTGYLMDKISLYIQSSRTLVSLRYGLCLKLISGELRFKAVVTKLTTVS